MKILDEDTKNIIKNEIIVHLEKEQKVNELEIRDRLHSLGLLRFNAVTSFYIIIGELLREKRVKAIRPYGAYTKKYVTVYML